MKKLLLSIGIISVCVFLSCKKDEMTNNIVDEPVSKTFTASIDNEDDTKTILNGKKIEWVSGDEITINGAVYTAEPKTDKTTATFTKKSGDEPTGDTYYAFYPTGIQTSNASGTLPATQTYVAGTFNNIPMFASSSSTLLKFKNICGILGITINKNLMANVKKIRVSSSNLAMSGAFTVVDNVAVLASHSTKTAVVLDCGEGAESSSSTFYIAIPAGDYADIKIELSSDGTNYSKFNTITAKDKETGDAKPVSVSASNLYSITLSSKKAHLNGVFTIDASGNKVYFSQGNLYYDGSNWDFEANQYDYRTYAGLYSCINGVISAKGTPNDNWGLFGWVGINGSIDADLFGRSTSTNYNDYSGSGAEDLKKEWGKTIDNKGTWRLLTNDEWTYMLKTRSGNRLAKANVHGVKGVVIFPDEYDGIVSGTGIAGLNKMDNTAFPSVSMDDATWTAMEQSGVVFLPATGYRSGEKVDYFDNNHSLYWSSTGVSGHFAGCLQFSSIADGSVWHYLTLRSARHDYGGNVRLVTNKK